MAKQLNYYEQIDNKNYRKLNFILSGLPPYCNEFFRNQELSTSSGTKVAYAYDLNRFFRFLGTMLDSVDNLDDIPLSVLDNLKTADIENYIEYLKYQDNSVQPANKNESINRKISSLKSFFTYMTDCGKMANNPARAIKLSRKHEKEIIRLEPDEVSNLLDSVDYGENLTDMQKRYHMKTRIRDLAILTVLLGTGIRISECVGLNMNSIDFHNTSMWIHRKGGKETTLYFGREVEMALRNYYIERKEITALPGHEPALFLSLRRKRISVSAAENLVKKYANNVTAKNITPHKLRNTYGTSLYRNTGDIYLVADVLGHSDVNTTRRHYAALDEDRKRTAKDAVVLRMQA